MRFSRVVALLVAIAGLAVPSSGHASTTPQSRTSRVAQAMCPATALFRAAVRKEHFDPHDPSYATFPRGERRRTVYRPVCDRGWALGMVNRPGVGTTDGLTLFRKKSRWNERALLEMGCRRVLRRHGVPRDVVRYFVKRYHLGSCG